MKNVISLLDVFSYFCVKLTGDWILGVTPQRARISVSYRKVTMYKCNVMRVHGQWQYKAAKYVKINNKSASLLTRHTGRRDIVTHFVVIMSMSRF